MMSARGVDVGDVYDVWQAEDGRYAGPDELAQFGVGFLSVETIWAKRVQESAMLAAQVAPGHQSDTSPEAVIDMLRDLLDARKARVERYHTA